MRYSAYLIYALQGDYFIRIVSDEVIHAVLSHAPQGNSHA